MSVQQLNQLAFSFAIPTNIIRHPVANTKPVNKSVRAAIENSMGEARVLCEQWEKSTEAGTLEAWWITWEFIELREQHSQHDEIRAEYALLRSIVADRYREIKNALNPIKPRYVNPNDPVVTWSGRGRKPAWFEACLASGMTIDQLEIGGGE